MEKKVWSKQEMKTFIARYKENPILWNPNTEGYRNLVQRRKIETNLSAEFNTTVSEIGRKIRILRGQWFKEYKKVNRYAMDGKEYQSNWIWFKPLEAIFGTNRNITVMGDDDDNISTDRNLIEDQQDQKIYICIKDDSLCEESSQVNFMDEEYQTCDNQTMVPYDDCQIFGNYVASQLRSMHYENNIEELKSFIDQNITKWQEKDDNEYYST